MKITCNKFNGGLAESRYDRRPNVALDMYHYDALLDPYVLHNHRALQKDTVSGGTNSGTEAVYCYDAVPRGTGTFIGLGVDVNGGTTTCKFYRKNGNDLNSYWAQSSSNAAPSIAYTPFYNGAFAFQTYVYGVTYTSGGATCAIYRYEGDANTTSMGTFSPTTASTSMARVTVHSQDATAYLGIGTTISKFIGTTITANVLTLPYTIISTCEYGQYLAILCVTPTGRGVVYLWGRDTTITTLQEIFLAGDDTPKYMFNINGSIIVISLSYDIGSSGVYLTTKLTARVLIGGKFNILKTITPPDTTPDFGGWAYTTWKDVGYFLDHSSNTQLYAVGFNRDGEFYISKDKSGKYDGETTTFCANFFNLGDYFGFSTNISGGVSGAVRISYNSSQLYSTIDSYWKSVPNPMMYQYAPDDLPKIKQVKKVWARFYANSAGYGTAVMKFTGDNNSEVTIFSESAPASKNSFVIEADTQTSGDQIGSGRDLVFKIITDQGIDLVDYGYEYDTENSQAG